MCQEMHSLTLWWSTGKNTQCYNIDYLAEYPPIGETMSQTTLGQTIDSIATTMVQRQQHTMTSQWLYSNQVNSTHISKMGLKYIGGVHMIN